MTTTAAEAAAASSPPSDAPTADGEGGLAAYVTTLTDEEVDVLGHGGGVVVAPWLNALDAGEAHLARTVAMRGLLARGIVSPAPDGAPPLVGADRAEVDVLVRDDVLSVLTLRRAAPVVVAVARTGATSQDWWYAHVVGDYTVLEEVAPDGRHRFALGRTSDLAPMLRDAALHPDAADGPLDDPGAVVVVPHDPAAGDVAVATAPPGLLRRLGDAHLRADVVVVRRDREAPRGELLGVFTGPDGSWLVRTAAGSGRVRVEPVAVEALAEALDAQAERAVATGAEAGR